MYRMKRAIHFDFHTMPGIDGLGKLFDAKSFAAILKDSHVGYINFFARCNRGFSYYPTKIGIPYPTEKGPTLLPEMLLECHKVGIGVTAYFNVSISGVIAEQHPEWTRRWKDNRPDKTTYMCFNSPYAEHLLAEINEVLEMYPDIDGIFADCLLLGHNCYCEHCRKKMADAGVDINDDAAVSDFARQTKFHMAERIRAMVPASKYLLINSLPNITPTDADMMNSHAEIEALTSGFWGYDSFPTSIAFERSHYKETIFMTGRFQDNWGDFGGINSAEGMEYDAFTALANGAGISIGDHLHPYGAPEKGLFDIVKPIYGQIEALEPWIEDSVYQSEIGVYAGSREFFYRCNSVFESAQRLLNELKYPFDIVTKCNDLSKYKVLILPDEIILDEDSAKIIKAYLADGGKVLSTGNSGLTPDGNAFALSEWDFKPFPENTVSPLYHPDFDDSDAAKLFGDRIPSFFRLKGVMANNTPDMVIRSYINGTVLKPGKTAQSLADHIPCENVALLPDFQYIPYGEPDGYSSIAVCGNVLHIGTKLFSYYKKGGYIVYKQMLDNALRILCPDKTIEAKLPSFSRCTLTRKGDTCFLHILSYCPEKRGEMVKVEDKIELYHIHCTLRIPHVKAVYGIPDKTDLPFVSDGKTVSFTIPKINGHAIFAIET